MVASDKIHFIVSKDRKDLSQLVLDQEISELRKILDNPVGSKEERIRKEALLKDKLPKVSNQTIARLYGDRYIDQEFGRRIKQGVQFELSDIFRIAIPKLEGSIFQKKTDKNFADLISKGIENSAPHAPKEKVEDLILEYAQTVFDSNTYFLPEVLSWRDDIGDITNSVLAKAVISDKFNVPDWYLKNLVSRVIYFRELGKK